jgi:hypothetical protein
MNIVTCAVQGSWAGLWVGSVVFGLSMAPVFPSTFALLETYFAVLGKHGTALAIGGAVSLY